MTDASRPESSSSAGWRVGGRYLNRKTRQPLTLRYVGTLPPDSANPNVWLGVEYDDPANGKGHSGTFEGFQVFQTRQEGAGAFLRLKRGDELEEGKTLVRAIKERYGLFDETDEVGSSDDGLVLGGSRIVVETPGIGEVRNRLKRLDKLKQIGLEGHFIASVGGEEGERAELRERLRGVTLLDVSRNLFEDWAEVADILDVLPSLRTLIINDSRLPPLAPEATGKLTCLKQLKELHLARSLITWDTLNELGPIMSGLEELHLARNPLGGAVPSVITLRGFGQLKLLSLEACGLTSWTTLETLLASLARLETLNVSSNPLIIDSTTGTIPVFNSLRSLIMLSTPIASLSSLASLSSRLPNICNLKHSLDPSLPLEQADPTSLSGNAADDRAVLIAFFPELTLLNGTEARLKDRNEAERRYLDTMSKLTRPSDSGEEWTRYDLLARKHGQAARPKSKPVAVKGQSLRSKLITLHIYAPGDEAVSMTILPSAPVALLRRKIAKKLNRPVDDLSLFTARRTQTDDRVITDASQVWVNEKVVKVEDGEVGYWFDDGDGVIVE